MMTGLYIYWHALTRPVCKVLRQLEQSAIARTVVTTGTGSNSLNGETTLEAYAHLQSIQSASSGIRNNKGVGRYVIRLHRRVAVR